jgi:chaperonin GroES
MKNIDIIPSSTGNRVLIKQREADLERNGIIIPDTTQIKPLQGDVVATSKSFTNSVSGVVLMPYLKAGDYVLYDPFSGIPVEIEGEEFLIMEESSIFCKL